MNFWSRVGVTNLPPHNTIGVRQMSDQKTRIGHNSINKSEYIGGVEYLHSALDEAVKLIVRLSKRNAKTDKLLNNSIYAKNNLQRGVHLNKAIEVQSKNKSELESFDKILTAINNRQDIHTGLNKSHKLEMCSQSGNFGNYIANNTGGPFDKDVVDVAFREADNDE